MADIFPYVKSVTSSFLVGHNYPSFFAFFVHWYNNGGLPTLVVRKLIVHSFKTNQLKYFYGIRTNSYYRRR